MILSLNEVVEKARGLKSGTIAVAVAQDDVVIEAVCAAREIGLAEALLVGDADEIKRIADDIAADISTFEIVDVKDKNELLKSILFKIDYIKKPTEKDDNFEIQLFPKIAK